MAIQLADRATALGFGLPEPVTTEDPRLCLELEGRRLAPISVRGGRYVFMLPSTGGPARLISRAGAPSDLRPWVEDRRQLGVMVRRLTLRREETVETVPLDHPAMGPGWWAVECRGREQWRWTDGAAELALRPGGPAVLEVDIAALPAYRVAELAAA